MLSNQVRCDGRECSTNRRDEFKILIGTPEGKRRDQLEDVGEEWKIILK
jgi:hypothetical protein